MSRFDKHFPNDAVEVCADCGKELPISELHFMEDYGWLCDDCVDTENQAVCSECNRIYNKEDCTQLEDDTWVCMDCDSDLYWENHAED